MLNFLNTTVLFAAVAALIPLIIHLFSKRKVKIIEFSSLKHLKTMQRRQVRRLKIRQLLLLILRMLIILLVVMAFARPTTEKGNIGSHASVSAVILFDNSASMNRYVLDGNLFDIAKKRTGQLLDNFGEGDEVSLVSLGRVNRDEAVEPFTSAAVAREKLDRASISYESARLGAALDHTVNLLRRAVNLNKEIYFVTDRQRHSLPDTNLPTDIGAVAYLVDLPLESISNCGITRVDFGGQLIMPGHDFTLTARVKNNGESDREDVIASLFLNGNRVSQADFSLTAGQETEVKFTRSVAYTGFHSGYVEISDDKFPGDNRYYFSFRIPERTNLLIIDGDGTGRILALALAPSPTINQYWSVKQARPEELSGINFWDYDVIFLAGTPLLGSVHVQRLKAFAGQGKPLFVTCGSNTDIDYFNSNWSAITGVTIDTPAPREFSRAGYYSFGAVEVRHPIFSVFNFETNALPEVKFFSLPTVRLSGNAGSILRFTGDRPALVENTSGNTRVLTLTAPIEARYSDLTGHAFFVPFVSRIAEYLAADLSSYDLKLFCGDNISRSVPLKTTVASTMYLAAPDGSQYALAPEEQQGSLMLRISNTDLPGIYSITHQGKEIDRFALNIDPAECELTAMDAAQFAVAVGATDMKRLEPESDIAAVISEFRFGKELWQVFIWLAAILFAIEILLARGSAGEET